MHNELGLVVVSELNSYVRGLAAPPEEAFADTLLELAEGGGRMPALEAAIRHAARRAIMRW